MNCLNCGKELKEGVLFCGECGEKVDCGEEDLPVQCSAEGENKSEITSNNAYIGKVCPFCKTPIEEGDALAVCSLCESPHHLSCWEENGGCTTFGCTGHRLGAEEENAEQGTVPDEGTILCKSCGEKLTEQQSFCPKCGCPCQPVVDSEKIKSIEQANEKLQKKKKRKRRFVWAGAIGALLILLAILICPKCKGLGEVDCPSCEKGLQDCSTCTEGRVSCPTCSGKGVVRCTGCSGNDMGFANCTACDNTGRKYSDSGRCYFCGGTGMKKTDCTVCSGIGYYYGIYGLSRCYSCHGLGYHTRSCHYCGGTGRYRKSESCSTCGGIGYLLSPCSICKGKVYLTCSKCEGKKTVLCANCNGTQKVTCKKCIGTGKITCKNCNGSRKRFNKKKK